MALININPKYLPSKKFVKIAGASLIVIFIIYMIFLYSKTYKTLKNPEITMATVPVQELLERDTDSDGVKDWEELLWGTDSTLSATFGTPDAVYVENKRKEIAAKNEGVAEEQNINDTEKIAREFLTTILSLKESGNLNAFNIANLADKFGQEIGSQTTLVDKYSNKDVKTGTDTLAAKKTYYAALTKAITAAKKQGMGTELEIIAKYFAEDTTTAADLNKIATMYTTFTKSLNAIQQVPPSAAIMHLELLNESNNMASIFKNINELNDNSIIGLIAIAQFQSNEPKMEATLSKFIAYFKASAIIK
ncbi:MAG TPA: hypothetical protein PK950_00870 [Candidatus Paceibacterota bacterium]|nr:hypothetical protein [Candidatus Paceibacterota bacterium]